MKHISLFSGLGGFDLASTWMGWENYASCEINQFGRLVLKYYWPDAYHHADVKTLTYKVLNEELSKRFGPQWSSNELILTGGFPCQPFSTAGQRKGIADDRHLWPEMLRVIWEVQPEWVVAENVRGLTNWNGGLVFDTVQSDLEAAGYQVLPFLLPAGSVGAPHIRYRIWFVAHRDDRLIKQPKKQIQAGWNPISVPRREGIITYPERQGLESSSRGEQRSFSEETGKFQGSESGGIPAAQHGPYAISGQHEQRSLITGMGRVKEYDARHSWESFPTQPPVRSRDDGFSPRLDGITVPTKNGGQRLLAAKHHYGYWRNESIKGYGNAIVPEVAMMIFRAIMQFKQLKIA